MNTNTLPLTFRVERDFAFGPDSFRIHLYARLPDSRIAIPESAITLRVTPPEDLGPSQPILTTGQEALQSLMDELWHLGIRPAEGHGSTGQLAATERHLDHTTRLLDSTLQTVLNVANASLLPKLPATTSQSSQ